MVSSAIAAIGVAISGANYIKQRRAESRARKAQKVSQRIERAQQVNEDAVERSRNAREERIRRARILASAEGSGAGGSSGASGAASAVGANFAAVVARQSGRSAAARGISSANQGFQDTRYAANRSKAFTELALGGLKIADGIYGDN